MAIDQLADLLLRWRQAGGAFSRGRVMTEAVRLVAHLDTDERRMLVRALTEQGAPELAHAIEQHTGGALGANQLRRLTDGLLALEDHQIDRLATTLRDPQQRHRLADEMVAHGVPAWDHSTEPAAAYRQQLQALPPPSGTEVEHQRPADQHLPDQDPPDRSATASEVADAEVTEPEVTEPEVTEPEVTEPEATEPEATEPEATVAEVADEVADEIRATQADGRHTAAVLLAEVRDARTATERLRLLQPAVLRDVDAPGALALLDAVPAGWQRRRVAERLLDSGMLPTDHLEEVFSRLDREGDMMFVAGSLLASGQVSAQRFEGILPERAVRRLIARSER